MPQYLIGYWNQRKLKELMHRVVVFVNDTPSAAVVFIVFWSYGRKICLNMCHGNSEIHMVVHIFSGFALFTELMWEYPGVESLCSVDRLLYQQTSVNQSTGHLKSGFIWKFSREWLCWTRYASSGSLIIAHCERNLNRHRIAVQGIFVSIIVKAGGASLKVWD